MSPTTGLVHAAHSAHLGLVKCGEAPPHPARTLAKNVGLLGLGAAGGYLGMEALHRVLPGGVPYPLVRYGVPLLTGVGALGVGMWHQALQEKMQRDQLERQRLEAEEREKRREST